MNKELELKYIYDNEDNLFNKVTKLLEENDFIIKEVSRKMNNDNYFDTEDLSLFELGGCARIRTTINHNDRTVQTKGTYKMPTGNDDVFLGRIEIENELTNANISELKDMLDKENINFDFNMLNDSRVLNIINSRTDVIISKNKKEACLSFDEITYSNHKLNELMVRDKMFEVESTDSGILKEVAVLIENNIPNLNITKESKYERGISKTTELHNIKNNQIKK